MISGLKDSSLAEIWRLCPSNNMYAVSTLGEVYSRYRKQKLKQAMKNNGYMVVSFNKAGHSVQYLVHRLVAEAFLENPENKPTVNHTDGKKRNNRLDNLAWATYSEQAQHAHATGLRVKRTKEVEVYTYPALIYVATYSSLLEASKATGASSNAISEIGSEKFSNKMSAKGFTFVVGSWMKGGTKQ